MINPLLLHLALAFAVGGLWITIVTIVAERSGSIVGGIVGGFPSISVFSFLFIGINQSGLAAVHATNDFPLIVSFSGMFVLVYATVSRKGFFLGLVSSFLAWLALVTFVVFINLQNFAAMISAYAVISTGTFLLFEKIVGRNIYGGARLHYSIIQIVLRSVVAGSIVALAVLSSQIGGPLFGGIFAAFPAVFTTTIWITSRSRGMEFSRAICEPLMISGTMISAPYGVAVRFLYPLLGVGIGTIASLASILPLVFVVFRLTSAASQSGNRLARSESKI